MCVAVPGKLIEIESGESRGRVDVRGNIMPVELGVVCAKVGDYVLLHAGCAIAVMKRGEAEELDNLLTSINNQVILDINRQA